MKLLDMCDELLIHICSFLNSVDMVALSETCERLNDVLCEANLVRQINLKAAYCLSAKTLENFLRSAHRRRHIKSLNLTSCFWLTSETISVVVLGLSNLQRLYVQETQLTLEHLFWIFKAHNTITHLSWTLNIGGCIQHNNLIDGIRKKLSTLEYLDIAGTSDHKEELHAFLLHCCNLKVLKMTCVKKSANYEIVYSHQKFNFPHLHSLVIQIDDSNHIWEDLISKILLSCKSVVWKTFWINSFPTAPAVNGSLKEIQAISAQGNKDNLQQILNSKYISHLDFRLFRGVRFLNALDSFLHNSSLTHILWGNGPLPNYLPTGLKHLYVYPEYCKDLRKPIAVQNISLMPHLISLSAPFCVFLQNEKNGCCRRPKWNNTEDAQGKCQENYNGPLNKYIHSENLSSRAVFLQKVHNQEPSFIQFPQESELDSLSNDCGINATTSKIQNHLNVHEVHLNLKKEDTPRNKNLKVKLLESNDLCYDCTVKLTKSFTALQRKFSKQSFETLENNEFSTLSLKKTPLLKYKNEELDNDNDSDTDSSNENPSSYEQKKAGNYFKKTSLHSRIGNDIQDNFLVSKSHRKFVKNITEPAEKRNDTNLSTTYESNYPRINDRNEDQVLESHHFHTSVIKPQDSSLLAQFALRTPNLKRLEIKDCIRLCNQMTSLEDLGSLQYISYWTKLECLFLASLPAELSSSLIQIGLCCPKLQRLGLHFIGHNSHLGRCVTRDVANMVTTLTQLKDFRFEDDSMHPFHTLLKALSKHSQLQRIAILKHFGEAPSIEVCYSLLEKCKILVFFYINTKKFSEEIITAFQQEVSKRFCSRRLVLWAQIDGQAKIFKETFPKIHYEEMINPAQLKIVPPVEE